MTEPLLLSIKAASRALNVGRSSIYNLLSTGELQSVHIGRRRLISIASVRSLADQKAEQ